jgi:hypothetical protein
VIGETAQGESDAAFCERLRDIGDALRQKSVVPEIGRGKRARGEEHHNRSFQGIRGLHGDVEREVVQSTLRALHPVDNTRALGIGWALAPNRDSGIQCQFKKCVHFFRHEHLQEIRDGWLHNRCGQVRQ